MIGSFLTRGLVMVFGYAYPAYECFKAVEMNKPDIEQLRFWCQYWILVAVMTVCERIGDTFISWVPMYSEAKLAFVIYLWYPKTKGTTYVYDSFFRPYISKHETEIDRNLLELRTRAGDVAILYWQKAWSYGQTRIFDILQYVALQSTPRPRPSQQPGVGVRQPTAVPNCRPPAAATKPQIEEPPSPTSSTSSSQHQEEVAQDQVPLRAAAIAASSASGSTEQKTTAIQPPPDTSKNPDSRETEAMQTYEASSSTNENANPSSQEAIVEEGTRVARARQRKTRTANR